MKDHGRIGKHGDPVQPVAGKGSCHAHARTVLGYRALGMTQIQEAAKVPVSLYYGLHISDSILDEGAWTSWEDWSACTAACGTGTHSRSRSYSAGLPCTGNSTHTASCYGEIVKIVTNCEFVYNLVFKECILAAMIMFIPKFWTIRKREILPTPILLKG